MQVDPGKLIVHWSIWLLFGVSPWMMMPKLLAYTSLLDHKQGKNIIMFSSMSDVLVVSPQADSPVEEGRVGKSIHLLWLQV